MSVFFQRQLRAAVNTSTGNQTFTHGTLTETPKLARFIMTNATADDTLTTHAILGRGWADGTKQYAFACSNDDSSTVTDTWSVARNTDCIYLIDQNGTCIAQGQFVSFGAGSVTVNWITAPSAAYLLTIELYGGTALEVASFDFSVDVSPSGTSVDTFTPFSTTCENNNLIGWLDGFASSPSAINFNNASALGAEVQTGFFAGGSSITQGVVDWFSQSDFPAAQYKTSNYAGDTALIVEHTDTTLNTSASITANDSRSVTISGLGGFAGGSCAMCLMRLTGSRGFTAKVIVYTNETATGQSKIASGFGFSPTVVLQVNTELGSKNAVGNAVGAEPVGFGSWNKDGEQFANSIYAKDGVGGANNRRSRTNDGVCMDVTAFSGARIQGTFTVPFNDGWNYSLANTLSTRQQLALAIAPPPGVVLKQGTRLTGGVRMA